MGVIPKIIFAENLVEHDLDAVAGVPVPVVMKAAGLCHATNVRRNIDGVNLQISSSDAVFSTTS